MLVEVREQIQALDLPGIGTGNILIAASPAIEILNMPSVRFPAVVIGPFGAEEVTAQSNLRDDVRYPVLLAICDTLASRSDEEHGDKQREGLDKRLGWRQTIRQALSNQRLTQTLGFSLSVTPLSIVETRAFERDLWVSSLLLRLSNREGRT
jgi:hypothetical protein